MGIRGNEEADVLAKNAAVDTTKKNKFYLPKPISKLKRTLTDLIMKQCQLECNYGDTGREAQKYYPKVHKNRLKDEFHLAQLYTTHGTFPAYVLRLKKANLLDCEFGSEGTPKHYLLNSSLTQDHHLVNIITSNETL